MTAISNLPMAPATAPTKIHTMTNEHQEEIRAAADVAWAAYTDAIQAVQVAPLDLSDGEVERLWLAAELAAGAVRRLVEA